MIFDIIIDNQYGFDYQLAIAERPVIPTAKRKVKKIEVPGRHGPLTKKEEFEDVSFKVKFNVLEFENIKPLLRKAKAWLMQAKTVAFTDDTVYRKIKSVEIGDIANEIEEYGVFEVTFTADPFEYAIYQPFEITKPGMIVNYGTFESLPKLTIYGNGTSTLTINGISFQLKNIKDGMIVDSELKETYAGTMPMNNQMVGKFPVFTVGENTISWTGTITKIVVEPRWCYI